MKASDFRPEHFENGRSFDKNDFNAYVQASDKLSRTIYTRYLPSVAVGLALSQLFSRGVGGFEGNILALLCIFVGLIVGGIFNAKAAKEVNAISLRLGITKKDVAIARKHIKNGTLAWNDFGEEESHVVPDQATVSAGASGETPAALDVPENPMRAVWAALTLTAGWFLLAAVQLTFGKRLLSSSSAYICLASAILGVTVYLITRSEIKWKLLGAVFGVESILLLSSSEFAGPRLQIFGQRPSFSLFFSFRDPLYMSNLGGAALAVLLSLAAVLIYSFLHKDNSKDRLGQFGVIACAVYLAARILPRIRLLQSMISHAGLPMRNILTQQIYPILTAALVIVLVYVMTNSLCHMPQTRVKLRGFGLIWAWLTLAGSVFMIFLILRVGIVSPRIMGIRVNGMYAYQIIIGLSALTGYTMLLCKKRIGLYFILLGVGLMLCAQLVIAVSTLGSGFGFNMIFSTLLGALNPLFAWLAVRAGDVPTKKQNL